MKITCRKSLYISTFIFAVIAVYGECPDEWTSYSGSCYVYVNVPETWAEGAEICERLGGYLAEITNTDENEFIKRFVKNKQLKEEVWIGGSDLLRNGTWRWLFSREEISFFDWAPGEPILGSNTRCIQLWPAHQYTWDDAHCNERNHILCETGSRGVVIG